MRRSSILALALTGAAALVLLLAAPRPAGRPMEAKPAHERDRGSAAAQQAAPATPTAPTPAPPSAAPHQLTRTTIPADSALHRELARLDTAARERALAALAAAGVPLADADSLHVDPRGALFYACKFAPAAVGPAEATAAADSATNTAITTTAIAAAAVPIASPPILHSRPGSTKVLYLDFNGAVVTGTAWNVGYDAKSSYTCHPFDSDNDPTQFSDAEQAIITEIWTRVTEDYAPFDVDVTTEEPASYTTTTAVAVITRSTDASGDKMPSSTAAGVGYLDCFGDHDYAYYRPVFVYYSKLTSVTSPRPDYIAEVISHELGHNMGLSHDGKGSTEYYSGHGAGSISWAPIMGSAYGRNVSQWSKGEYYNADNNEDDLAILDAKLRRRADTIGATPAAADQLPDVDASVSATGLIETSTDQDTFRFYSEPGSVTLTASPFRAATRTYGGNTDLKIELLDAAGTIVATAEPATLTTATLLASLTSAGYYYARLSPTGAGTPLASSPTGYTVYGSLGQYTLAVTRRLPAATLELTASPAAAACLPGGSATFTAAFNGTPAPTLAWQFYDSANAVWADLAADANHQDVSSTVLTVVAAPTTLDGRRYRCRAANGLSVNSAEATLTVAFTWPLFRASRFSAAELLAASTSGPEADADADGVTNFLEYAFGREPRAADSIASLLSLHLTGATPRLTYRQFHQPRDLTYVLERSADLVIWTAVTEAELARTTTAVTSAIDAVELEMASTPDTDRQFYRLRVTSP